MAFFFKTCECRCEEVSGDPCEVCEHCYDGQVLLLDIECDDYCDAISGEWIEDVDEDYQLIWKYTQCCFLSSSDMDNVYVLTMSAYTPIPDIERSQAIPNDPNQYELFLITPSKIKDCYCDSVSGPPEDGPWGPQCQANDCPDCGEDESPTYCYESTGEENENLPMAIVTAHCRKYVDLESPTGTSRDYSVHIYFQGCTANGDSLFYKGKLGEDLEPNPASGGRPLSTYAKYGCTLKLTDMTPP